MGISIVMGLPQQLDGFLRENPLNMDDLKVPPFMETLK